MASTLEQAFLNAGFKPVKPRKQRDGKVQKCHKCGHSPMEYIPHTNIMVCTGDIEVKDENGLMKMVPCGNKYIFTNR